MGGCNGKDAITLPINVMSPSEDDKTPFTVGNSAPTYIE